MLWHILVLKNAFQLVAFQFGGSDWHFFLTQNGHVLSEGALTICFEERISADRRGILELTALRSSHYQFENEPFAKKNWPGLPLSQ